MSKSKSKAATKASKPDLLTKVKGAAIAKPAQSGKAKSKEIAKKVAAKEDKKDKKNKKVPVKEPTPEPESEEEDDSDDSSEGESEVEDEVKNTKTNGVKTRKEAESSDESESESESESGSEDEAPKSKISVPKAAQVNAKESDSDEGDDSSSSEDGDDSADEEVEASKATAAERDDESSDESESDEEEKPASKTNGVPATAVADTDSASDGESDEDDEDDEDDESSDEASENDSSGDSETSEIKADTKQVKRKAEDDAVPVAKKTKVEDVTSSPNLFIGNLSWNVDEEWLRQEFEEFGELKGVRLMTDRQTGRSKGFGYVEFVNAADAAKAHSAKQGAELDGRAMNVDFANTRPNNGERQENRRKSYGDQTGEPSDTLFLGNLSFDVTPDDVSEAFGPHGTIVGVRLPTDRDTGAPKGFGYVTFATVEEATAALEAMQGGYIKSRSLRLDYSQPRQQNGDSPARGGFGGRGSRGGFGGRGRGGRGDFGGRGGRGGGRGGRPMTTNRGGFGDFSGRKTTF